MCHPLNTCGAETGVAALGLRLNVGIAPVRESRLV